MSSLTTHILDTSAGKPAPGIDVVLEQHVAGQWEKLGSGISNDDGRIHNLLSPDAVITPGIYRLTFHTKNYFSLQNKKCFYPQVTIEFEVTDSSHYHVPLLLSPFGYSTYRGS